MTFCMWQVEGGEYSLKMSAPWLYPLGNENLLKIWRKRMFIGVYRTAPATLSLFKMDGKFKVSKILGDAVLLGNFFLLF